MYQLEQKTLIMLLMLLLAYFLRVHLREALGALPPTQPPTPTLNTHTYQKPKLEGRNKGGGECVARNVGIYPSSYMLLPMHEIDETLSEYNGFIVLSLKKSCIHVAHKEVCFR